MYFVAALVVSTLIFLLSLWIRWRKHRMSLLQRYGIPGPKPNLITGNLNDFNEKRQACLYEWTEKYGKIFGFYLGGKPFLLCTDVELIRIIQVKDVKNFINRDVIIPDAGLSHRIVFNGFIIKKDNDWKNERSIASTSFSTAKIKKMSTLMTDSIKTFLAKIKEQCQKPFDIAELYKMLTFDVICRSAFGVQTNVQNKEMTTFVRSVNRFCEADSSDFTAAISILFPEFEPIPTYIRLINDYIRNLVGLPAAGVVIESCKQIIEARKKSEHRPPDLLQTLLDAEDKSDEEIRKLSIDSVIANSAIYMAAGHDTTSSTLQWCTHLLCQNPEVQERVRQEINDNIENHKDIEYNDLTSLHYLDQVISETLRLYPTAILAVNRICAEDFVYKDITIPKGVTILVAAPILHRHSDYWHEPEKFDPDRFSSENRGNIDSFVYQPFGAGPRICIGYRLSQTIMKLVLANLIRSFRLEPCKGKEVEMNYSLFINHAKNGIFVKAIPLAC